MAADDGAEAPRPAGLSGGPTAGAPSAGAPEPGDAPLDRSARRARIRERVAAEGFVRTGPLAADFGVSPMTVHRDLDALQAQGWLRRVRGGATGEQSSLFHGDIEQRMSTMAEAKDRLAAAAVRLLSPGRTVLLDESTTCLRVARRLPQRAPLTVVTHFLPVIKLLAGEPGIDLIALGGRYFMAYDAFLGFSTAESVRDYRADVLFLSTTAIQHGSCYHQSQETVHVKRAMMAAAEQRVLLVDHTKFSRRGVFALAPLTDFDLVLVDDAVPAAELRAMRALGVDVRVVAR